MRKKKILHPSWMHLDGVANISGYFTKDATATEVWVEFDKDFTDGDGKTFKKGETVGLDSDEASYLIKKKIAKETKKPDEETLLKGITSKLEETIFSKVTDTINETITKATNRLGNTKFSNPAIPTNHDAVYGFDDKGDFLKAVMDASKPSGAVISPKFFKGVGEEMFGSFEAFQKGTPSGQNTLVDDEGAILIPDVIADGIWEYAFDEEEIMSKTDQRQTSGNSLKIKTVPETSRKDGYRHAGALAYWLAEADQYSSTSIKWGEQRLELHKLGALLYCTQEELDDAAIALAPQFDKRAGEAIRWAVNKSFFLGTGAGQPQGITRSNAMQTVTQRIGAAADATIGHYDINAMYHRMLPDLRAGAEWLVHPNLYEQLDF
jgi:HK97 family phage major capsid protein